LLNEAAAHAELARAGRKVWVEAGGTVKVTAVEHGVVEVDQLGNVELARESLRKQYKRTDADFEGAVQRVH
jgi:hypothetical protein